MTLTRIATNSHNCCVLAENDLLSGEAMKSEKSAACSMRNSASPLHLVHSWQPYLVQPAMPKREVKLDFYFRFYFSHEHFLFAVLLRLEIIGSGSEQNGRPVHALS